MNLHNSKHITEPSPPRSAPPRSPKHPLPANLAAQAHMLAAADAMFRMQDRVAGIIERRARGRRGVLTASDVLRPLRRARLYDLQFAQLATSVSEDLIARRADGTIDPKQLKKRNDEFEKQAGELFVAVSRLRLGRDEAGPALPHRDTGGQPSPADDARADHARDVSNDKTNPP